MGNLFSAPTNPSETPQPDSSPSDTTSACTSCASTPKTLPPKQESTLLQPSCTPSHIASSPSPPYTVFISHAGEDKATIAIPLRQKLLENGITAFVDEEDMPIGTDAVPAMMHAMQTAKIGVFVLSPEFVAKKWPMKELMHFLKRRDECLHEPKQGREPPIIVPCFYRLGVAELYNEPKLDRKDQDGNLLYQKWRFFERQDNHEPEASIEKVKAALTRLHGIMGVRNTVEANNDSSYEMSRKRGLLLEELCSKICKCVPEGLRMHTSRDMAHGRKNDSLRADSFRPLFPPKLASKKAVLDFDSRDAQGNPITAEGLVKQYLLEQEGCAADVVSLHGLGGVGKSTTVEALMSDDDVRHNFPDGVHLIKLGSDASSITFFQHICRSLEESGAEEKVKSLRQRNDIEEALSYFVKWFSGKRCAFFIDDVWERVVKARTLSRLCDVTSGGSGNKLLITTREYEIASVIRGAKIVTLHPRERIGVVALEILLFHAECDESDIAFTSSKDTICEILDICAGLPVSLAAAGKNVKKLRTRITGPFGEVWILYLSKLRTNQQRLLRQNVGSYGNLYATFATSLEFLDERPREEMLGFRTTFSFAEMHRRLCVLQKQSVVPNTVLMHLWGVKSEENADSIATMFVDVGLASFETVRSRSDCTLQLTVHDSILDFAVSEAYFRSEIMDAHNFLLEGYGSPYADVSWESEDKTVRWWSRELKDDGYLHKNLSRHLVGSGRKKELCQLLLTPRWAERQIEVNGILFLENDFGIGMGEIAEDEETEEALLLIANAVSLSSTHIVTNSSELWFQVHGRLKGYGEGNQSIYDYVKWIETNAMKPRVLSVKRFLAGAGGRSTKIIPVSSLILYMALFNDEGRVALGTAGGLVLIVNISRSIIEGEWDAHDKAIWSIAVGRNDTRIVTTSYRDGIAIAKVWDVKNGQCLTTFSGLGHHKKAELVATTHDGRHVVSTSLNGMLEVWDIESGEVVTPVINLGHRVRCISLLKDGERAVIGGYDGALELWNISTGARLWKITTVATIGESFEDGKFMVNCLAVTPGERQVVSGLHGDKMILWDLETHQKIQSFKLDNTLDVMTFFCVAVSKDGRRIACGADGKSFSIQIFDVESGDEVCDPLMGHSGPVEGISFLRNKDTVVSCSADGTVRLWDIPRRQNDDLIDGHQPTVEIGKGVDCSIKAVSFTPDGKFVVTSSWDHTLQIWDASSGQTVGDPLVGHSKQVQDVTVTQDGRFAVSVSNDKTIRVWDLESRNLLQTLKGHTDSILSVAVTPKGDRAVTCSSDHTVRVWDLTKMDGSHTVFLGQSDSGLHKVFLSDDGLRVISVALFKTFVWNMESQEILKIVKLCLGFPFYIENRSNIFRDVGERTAYDEAGLHIGGYSENMIIHKKESKERVLATLESRVKGWDLSPDKTRMCLGLETGQVVFLNVDV